MSLINIELVSIFAVAAFVPQIGFRVLFMRYLNFAPITSPLKFTFGVFSSSVLVALMGLGIFGYWSLPTPQLVMPLVSAFAPHAYNLILWPAFALAILAGRFGTHMLIPALMFVYGLDEILWNALAFSRFAWVPDIFAKGNLMWWATTAYWQLFFVGMIGMTALGYYVVRPRVKLNITWLILAAFGAYWAAIGMPTGAVDVVSTVFELLWQTAFWLFVTASVQRRV